MSDDIDKLIAACARLSRICETEEQFGEWSIEEAEKIGAASDRGRPLETKKPDPP